MDVIWHFHNLKLFLCTASSSHPPFGWVQLLSHGNPLSFLSVTLHCQNDKLQALAVKLRMSSRVACSHCAHNTNKVCLCRWLVMLGTSILALLICSHAVLYQRKLLFTVPFTDFMFVLDFFSQQLPYCFVLLCSPNTASKKCVFHTCRERRKLKLLSFLFRKFD